MAGFKQTVKDHSPVLFLTFDYDEFFFDYSLDSPTRTFMDESGNDNHPILVSDNYDIGSTFYGYRMGGTSLVSLETSNQYSCCFGYYGLQPTAPQGPYPHAFISAMNIPQYEFYNGTSKLGSYTIGFMMKKVSDESAFRSYLQSISGPWTGNFRRNFVRKVGTCDIYYTDNYSGQDTISFSSPGGVISAQVGDLLTFYNRDHLFVFTWDVVKTGTTTYDATARIYMDARIVAQQTWQYSNAVPLPDTNSISDWEIMGRASPSVPAHLDNRHTSPCYFDQMFVLTKALSIDEVARLWKKTKTYSDMVAYSNPHSFWRMDEDDSASSAVMPAMYGADGEYLGGVQRVVRERPGPPNLPVSRSVKFQDGGCARVRTTSGGGLVNYFNPAGDYSITMWAKLESQTRGVVFSIQSDVSDFPGIKLEWNKSGNNQQLGSLQFSTTQGTKIHAHGIDSSEFHLINLIRRGTTIELWIDGILRDHSNTPLVSSSAHPGQVYMMGMLPGDLNVSGNLALVEMHSYALQEQEIRIRWTYAKIYRMSGIVLNQGHPWSAEIRINDHITGELIQKTKSSGEDGAYEITLYDNRRFILTALDLLNEGIRPRAFGPIEPAYYDDAP